ncbi:histone deacetylase 5-like isoform X2 [Watersipora subatra]|uniref:histone deacetylase 5-like isoform X2 n=1 Tax=Watersipora subatra TaxID=2589382 RepID=UPI00355C72DD
MSDTQKSPNNGLSDADILSSAESSNGRLLAGLSRSNMEINTASSRAADLTASLRSSADKGLVDGKLFSSANPYFPGVMPAAPLPLVNPNTELMNQQLLKQMRMLSFYQSHIYQVQQKKFESDRLQQSIWEQERLKEDQRMEVQKLSMIKQKPKEQESAIASDEVKLHLRTALMNKLRRNVPNQSQGDISETGNHSWQRSQSSTSPPPSALGSSMSPPTSYHNMGGVHNSSRVQDVEFPIRKTASEPNLKVKSMLKQKLGHERRNSPMMARRRPLDVSYGNQLPESINGLDPLSVSPPINLGSTPAISAEVHKAATKRSFEEALANRPSVIPDSLYISMPNISTRTSQPNKPMTDAELRASQASSYGLPLAGHLYPSAFQRSIPGITEEEYVHSLGALTAMHDARRLAHPYLSKAPNLNATIDPQTLNAQRHIRHQKPLSRTQSAPLPVMTSVAANLLLPQQQALLEQQELVKQHQDQISKQHQKKQVLGVLRQTLLQRSSSKNHMEQVDEESEARLLQEMQESREDNFESQQKSVHSSHGSIYAAALAAKANASVNDGLDLSTPYNSSKRFPLRFLSRTNSSPLVAFGSLPSMENPLTEAPIDLATKVSVDDRSSTGVVYDESMLRHHCPCQDNAVHLENPSRIQSIWNRLKSSGLADRCRRVEFKKATIEQLQLCHTESYSIFFGVNSQNRQKLGLTLPELRFQRLTCGGIGVDADTVWNEDCSPLATRMAVGSVIELSSRVYESQLKNGIAIVRPPGHHSESGQAMGFCFFNAVAIAAKHLKHKLGASKILILDWDVHHGNGTQQMTYDDPCILYISIHRHDNGMFFPGTGSLRDCGSKQGLGFNVNIAFNGGLEPPMSDAEYMAAFRSIVMPIVREFKPQITLVSAGFDGADGHANQLGGYKISPAGFGFMTKELMSASDNKVVLVLEGGYNLSSICDASEMCTRALLGESVPLPNQEEVMRPPCKNAVETLEECSRIQTQFWPMVAEHKDKIVMSFVDSLRLAKPTLDSSTSSSKSIDKDDEPIIVTEPMEES